MWLTTLLTTMGTIGSTIIYVIPIYRHLAARKKTVRWSEDTKVS